MAIDFAQLAVAVDYKDVPKATAELDKLTAAGTRTEAATGKLGATSASASRPLGAWAKMNETSAQAAERHARALNFVQGGLFGITGPMNQVAAATERATAATHGHRLALGRVGLQLETLTAHIAGVHPVIGKLVSILGDFAVGSQVTVGVLAGLAAIAVAYDKLTESSRKAMEVGDKLIEHYTQLARISALGIAGQQRADIEDMNKGLEQHAKWLNVIVRLREALGGATSPLGAVASLFEGSHREQLKTGPAAVAAAEQQRVNAIGLQDARDNEAFAARVKAEADKAKALAERLRVQRDREQSERFLQDAEADKHRTEDLARARQLGLVPDRTQIPLVGQLSDAQMKLVGSSIRLDEEYAAAKKIFSSMTNVVDDFKRGLEEAAVGFAQQFSPGAIAGNLLGKVAGNTSSVGGQLGGLGGLIAGSFAGPWGAAIGAAIGSRIGNSIQGLFGGGAAERTAQREAADSAHAMALQIDAVTKALSGDQLGAAINALQIQLISALLAINSALPGTKNEAERNRLRALAEEQERQQEARVRHQDELNRRYAQEDLEVRNLRALGRDDEADRLAFEEQQQREMQKAIDEGRDATYLNTLATVQNNEWLAFLNGTLEDAVRNAPTGFYGIAGYAGQFATPYGTGSSPADPFGTGMIPPNYPIDLNPSGGLSPRGGLGKSTVTYNIENITIDGTKSSKEVVRDLLDELDQVAASTGGGGSSRSAALDVARR